MEQQTAKKKSPKIILIILLLVLFATGIGFFFLYTQTDLFLSLKSPPNTYFASGDIQAMTLLAPDENSTREELKLYFEQAVTFAKTNGFNTVVFEGKKDLTVYWRDSIFPTAAGITAQDTFFHKLDPLALLCDAAQKQDVQVWLSLAPYASGGFSSEMKGKAIDLAIAQGGINHTQFSPSDADFNALLTTSLQKLPHKYAIAGVILQDLPPAETTQNTESALLQQTADKTHAYWVQKGFKTNFILQFNTQTSFVTPTVTAALAQRESLQYIMPQIPHERGIFSQLTAWAGSAKTIVTAYSSSPDIAFFSAAKLEGYAGALFGGFQQLQENPAQLGLLRSALSSSDGVLPLGFTIPQTLKVTYPTSNDKVYNETIFVMGTSDPTLPLFVNGAEISVRAPGGAFGVAMPLQEGENTFTFTQDGSESTIVLIKPAPIAPTTPSSPATMPSDGTVAAEEGQAIEITNTFTSALTDINDSSSMNETFYKGAVAVVQDSVEMVRYNPNTGRNEKSWAYRITGGDYILASQGRLIENGNFSFSGLTAEPHPYGETLHFNGSGTPAAYLSSEKNTLTITMHDTSFSLPEGFSSQLVTSAKVNPIENGVELILQIPSLWGYSIEYKDGQTSLFLKKPPVLGKNPERPLEGVRVMLDPGHGGEDAGALGVMGAMQGPNEKDLNLRLAEITAYRLRQLGAEVIMTRTEDIFIPTMDLLLMQIETKPDFYISLHHNSAELDRDRNSATGVQSYFFIPPNYDAPLSGTFAQNLITNIGPATVRPGDTASWGYYNVLRTPVSPAVLFEYGFVINPSELEDIASTDGMYAAACATANGIIATIPAEST